MTTGRSLYIQYNECGERGMDLHIMIMSRRNTIIVERTCITISAGMHMNGSTVGQY